MPVETPKSRLASVLGIRAGKAWQIGLPAMVAPAARSGPSGSHVALSQGGSGGIAPVQELSLLGSSSFLDYTSE